MDQKIHASIASHQNDLFFFQTVVSLKNKHEDPKFDVPIPSSLPGVPDLSFRISPDLSHPGCQVRTRQRFSCNKLRRAWAKGYLGSWVKVFSFQSSNWWSLFFGPLYLILFNGGVTQNQPMRLQPTKLGSYFVLQLVIHVTMLMMNVILLLDSLGGVCPCQ